MRFAWAILLPAVAAAGCGGGGIFQEYEYEEELYLSVDGSATLHVNSSIDALNTLRGTSFDAGPNAIFPRTELREYFNTPATRITRLSGSRRHNRRYAHVRMDVDDVRALGEDAPFGWSDYRFGAEGDLLAYRQSVGAAARRAPAAGAAWAGGEVVAFRIHVPSRIEFHNAGEEHLRRGNILVWEQPLSARLRGEPIEIDIRMQSRPILNQTLWLFAVSGLAVAILFGAVIMWLLLKGGGGRGEGEGGRGKGGGGRGEEAGLSQGEGRRPRGKSAPSP